MSYKAQDFIEAIKGSGGIVTVIADRVGCTWHTAKKYIDEFPTVAQAYANETEKVLDRAESVLIGNINSGDSADAKWYLTKKGKHRGYGDSFKLETWQSELINLLLTGQISPDDIEQEFGADVLNELIKRTGAKGA